MNHNLSSNLCLEKSNTWNRKGNPLESKLKTGPTPMCSILSNRNGNKMERVEKTVEFNNVYIRSYEQTIGDNPSTSDGPPISLDWDYNEEDAIQIDAYEFGRPRRRNSEELRLSNNLRRKILMDEYGCKASELNDAAREVERAVLQRSITRYLLPVRKVEEFVESCRRKARRASGRGGN